MSETSYSIVTASYVVCTKVGWFFFRKERNLKRPTGPEGEVRLMGKHTLISCTCTMIA